LGGCGLGDDKKVIWIDDCDDTLIHTTWKYEVAHLEACRIILQYAQHHAPYMTQLIELRQRIDDATVEAHGFVEGYFEKTLHDCFEKVCGDAHIPVSAEVKRQLTEVSKHPLDPQNYSRRDLVEGAPDVLAFQARPPFEVYVVTRGITAVQLQKAENIGLYEFVPRDHVFVVEKNDKVERWKAIAAGKDPSRVFVLEDSLAMTNAATDCGFWGVFIPEKRGCQVRERSQDVKNKQLTIPLESILEVKSEYPQYRTWAQRERVGDLPQYMKAYDRGG